MVTAPAAGRRIKSHRGKKINNNIGAIVLLPPLLTRKRRSPLNDHVLRPEGAALDMPTSACVQQLSAARVPVNTLPESDRANDRLCIDSDCCEIISSSSRTLLETLGGGEIDCNEMILRLFSAAADKGHLGGISVGSLRSHAQTKNIYYLNILVDIVLKSTRYVDMSFITHRLFWPKSLFFRQTAE